MKKGQVSVELMIIIGIILILIIPSIVFVFNFIRNEGNDDFAVSQADVITSRIKYTINMVGSTGTGSALKTEIEIPYGFEGISTEEDEIILKMWTSPGLTDFAKVTDYQIISNGLDKIKAPGTYILEISALNETYVNVTLM
ncbi:MAG: class III signal peptide-containing protein [Candidatus Micrarchaeia archaeon]|jgi:hypothetical protein